MPHYLAIDLGAESGRAILGTLSSGRIETEEIHRFANEPVRLGETLCWDVPRLFHEILIGIQKASARTRGHLDGIAVDSWGVDFGLIDPAGDLLALPVHYRDGRTKNLQDAVYSRTARENIFDITGLQFLEFNTIFQLAAIRKKSPEILRIADRLLFMADLFAHFLCGRAACEQTLASTSQLLDARSRTWSERLFADQELPLRIMPEVLEPGTVLAPLRPWIVERAGLRSAPHVIAGAGHDTAAAIAAVPASGTKPWAYISSGTWSLVGIEVDEPVLERNVMEHGFTNEAGVFGTTRLLRNISGLWLVQECRRQWSRKGEEFSYEQLSELAEAAPAARAWLDLDDPELFLPGDMPARIQQQCKRRGQTPPGTHGEVIRCALESLAREYLRTIRSAEELGGQKIESIHIVGGGSLNKFLNQLTANTVGVPVIAGPSEATAIGNIMIQARARGEIQNLEELRAIVEASSTLFRLDPQEPGGDT